MTTATKIGTGEFTYEVAVDWETLPPGYTWQEAAAVAVSPKDEVYVYNRSDHPVIVFDTNGRYLRDWGDPAMYPRAHGITFAPDGTLFLIDDDDHTVRKCTPEGKVIFTLGTPGVPTEYMSGQPFHRPTDVAIDPNTGDFYVADGYGNSRVHKYSPDGNLLFSWGEPGVDPGQFNITHNIATDADGYVYVADRENHRVQIFDSDGNFEMQWKNMHRPCAIYVSDDQHVFVGDLGAGHERQSQHAEHRAVDQRLQPERRASGASRRRLRRGARPVHRSARYLHGLTGQPVCRRGVLDEHEEPRRD